jgi:2-dehydropantoate 2-reductase
MRDVVAECLAMARGRRRARAGDMDEAVQRIALTMPTQLSSTAQDLARGKRTEIDHLNGHVVRCGDALGVPTPANRVLYATVRLLQERPLPALSETSQPVGRLAEWKNRGAPSRP